MCIKHNVAIEVCLGRLVYILYLKKYIKITKWKIIYDIVLLFIIF